MQFAGLNGYAVVLAAVLAFMFGWLWYGMLFSDAWLAAVGKSRGEVKEEAPSPTPFIISFIGLIIMGLVLAVFLGYLGPGQVTAGNGVLAGTLAWLGFVITTMTINNVFRSAKLALTLIDGGHWLGVLLLQGAVIGWVGV